MLALEFLSEDEVELAAALLSVYGVETVSPVDTHQAYHRKEDTYTDTGGALHVEGIKLLGLCPRITTLNECEAVDGSVAEEERIAELQRHTVIGISLAPYGVSAPFS